MSPTFNKFFFFQKTHIDNLVPDINLLSFINDNNLSKEWSELPTKFEFQKMQILNNI